jgi:HlyD family secretion protein
MNTQPTRKTAISVVISLMALSTTACQEQDAVSMVGTLERDRIDLKVESSEPVTAIHARDGQTVRAGDLVLEQDRARAQARYEQQAALHHQAVARLAELRRGPRVEAIRETQAKLAAAQALTDNAQADLKRAQEIFDQGLSNQAALDQAESRWKSSQAEQAAVLEALDAQLKGTTAEELDQAEAAAAAAKALVEQAELDLQRTRVLAPANGTIDKLLFQVGERPAAGSTIAVLLDDSRVYARIYVPEYLRATIQPGESVSVRIDVVKETMPGTVRWVSTDASFTPYFALTEHDRSRLSYLAEVDIPGASSLPSGIPVVVLKAAE